MEIPDHMVSLIRGYVNDDIVVRAKDIEEDRDHLHYLCRVGHHSDRITSAQIHLQSDELELATFIERVRHVFAFTAEELTEMAPKWDHVGYMNTHHVPGYCWIHYCKDCGQ